MSAEELQLRLKKIIGEIKDNKVILNNLENIEKIVIQFEGKDMFRAGNFDRARLLLWEMQLSKKEIIKYIESIEKLIDEMNKNVMYIFKKIL